MNIINYIFSKPKSHQPTVPLVPLVPLVPSNPTKKNKPIKYKTVYLVVNKSSQLPLGIYDTDTSTLHNVTQCYTLCENL